MFCCSAPSHQKPTKISSLSTQTKDVGLAATNWPSGLRRWLQAPVLKGVGSNPTAVTFRPRPISSFFGVRATMCVARSLPHFHPSTQNTFGPDSPGQAPSNIQGQPQFHPPESPVSSSPPPPGQKIESVPLCRLHIFMVWGCLYRIAHPPTTHGEGREEGGKTAQSWPCLRSDVKI